MIDQHIGIRQTKTMNTVIYKNEELHQFDSDDEFEIDESGIWDDVLDTNERELLSDSSSAEEEDEILKNNESKHYCVIPLESGFKFFWDHLQLVMMIYVATLVPYKVCFIEETIIVWEYFDYLIDFLFFLDMVFTFFTPIIIKESIVSSHIKIAFDYIKFWFWLDLFSVFPFDYVMTSNADFVKNYSILLKISKMPRLYKFMKGAKMLRTIKVQKKGSKTFVSKIVSYFAKSDHVAFSVIPIYAAGIAIAHIFCCIWYFIASNSDDPSTWVSRYNYTGERIFDRYCASLYYIYTTFTTTGYGDMVPGNFLEMFVTVIFVVCGVTFLSFVYTTMMAKFNEFQEKNEYFNQKRILLKNLLDNRLIDKRLHKEMEVILEEHQQSKNSTEIVPSYKGIKPKYITKLTYELCFRKYHFQKISFFDYLPRKVWIQFAEKIEERIYTKGENIFEQDAPSGTFYIIKRGKVWLMTNPQRFKKANKEKDTSFSTSSESEQQSEDNSIKEYPFVEVTSFFGERECLTGEVRRWSAIAKKNTLIYAISKAELLWIFNEDRMRKALEKISTKRFRHFRKFEQECINALDKKDKVEAKILAKKNEIRKSLRKSIRLRDGNEKDKKWTDALAVIRMQNGVVDPLAGNQDNT